MESSSKQISTIFQCWTFTANKRILFFVQQYRHLTLLHLAVLRLAVLHLAVLRLAVVGSYEVCFTASHSVVLFKPGNAIAYARTSAQFQS